MVAKKWLLTVLVELNRKRGLEECCWASQLWHTSGLADALARFPPARE